MHFKMPFDIRLGEKMVVSSNGNIPDPAAAPWLSVYDGRCQAGLSEGGRGGDHGGSSLQRRLPGRKTMRPVLGGK